MFGGTYGIRTRDLWRDKPLLCLAELRHHCLAVEAGIEPAKAFATIRLTAGALATRVTLQLFGTSPRPRSENLPIKSRMLCPLELATHCSYGGEGRS